MTTATHEPGAESRLGPACCPTGLSAPLTRQGAEELAGLLKAVADPARLQILSLLRSSQGCSACVCDLTEPLGLSQATVSHHLRILTEAGLVEREKRGYWTWYSIIPSRLAELGGALS
ncbi:MAG TPA: transcriptional regulator [Actinobacteria bacterium]|jgi:ArsR family transcriptional regulator|nr:transcriptional regulator [Actinomycetota bacterium]